MLTDKSDSPFSVKIKAALMAFIIEFIFWGFIAYIVTSSGSDSCPLSFPYGYDC